MVISAKLGSYIWQKNLPPLKRLNPEKSKQTVINGVKGEYTEIPQKGYDGTISQMSWKSVVLSLILPCVIVSDEFKVFEVSAGASTIIHVVISAIGLYICPISMQANSFNFSNTTGSQFNDTSIQGSCNDNNF